jgi:hypothetical protein
MSPFPPEGREPARLCEPDSTHMSSSGADTRTSDDRISRASCRGRESARAKRNNRAIVKIMVCERTRRSTAVPRSLFVHKSPCGDFRRQGSSKREMSTEVLLRVGRQRRQAGLIRT